MTLHALIPSKEERFIVRGELRVQWRTPADPSAEPFPEVIEATDLDQALAIGKLCPAQYGGVEVRPIMVFE